MKIIKTEGFYVAIFLIGLLFFSQSVPFLAHNGIWFSQFKKPLFVESYKECIDQKDRSKTMQRYRDKNIELQIEFSKKMKKSEKQFAQKMKELELRKISIVNDYPENLAKELLRHVGTVQQAEIKFFEKYAQEEPNNLIREIEKNENIIKIIMKQKDKEFCSDRIYFDDKKLEYKFYSVYKEKHSVEKYFQIYTVKSFFRSIFYGETKKYWKNKLDAL